MLSGVDRGGVTSFDPGSTYYPTGQGNTEALGTSGATNAYWITSRLGLLAEKYVGASAAVYERDGNGRAIGARDASDPTMAYYVTDALGSVIGLFFGDGNYAGGYSYDPYGQTRYQTAGYVMDLNHLRYISGQWDSDAGLYKLGARFYDPSIGRFNQADPSGQEENPYSYAGCNPVNATDPTGLDAACNLAITAFVLAAVGFVTSAATLIISAFAAAPTFGVSAAVGALGAAGFIVSGAGRVLAGKGIADFC